MTHIEHSYRAPEILRSEFTNCGPAQVHAGPASLLVATTAWLRPGTAWGTRRFQNAGQELAERFPIMHRDRRTASGQHRSWPGWPDRSFHPARRGA